MKVGSRVCMGVEWGSCLMVRATSKVEGIEKLCVKCTLQRSSTKEFTYV